MNPITMIDQEFARMVVEDWSDAAAMCRQEQGADKSRSGIVTPIRALVIRVRSCIDRRQGRPDPRCCPNLRTAEITIEISEYSPRRTTAWDSSASARMPIPQSSN
jgi:hypothetical protein